MCRRQNCSMVSRWHSQASSHGHSGTAGGQLPGKLALVTGQPACLPDLYAAHRRHKTPSKLWLPLTSYSFGGGPRGRHSHRWGPYRVLQCGPKMFTFISRDGRPTGPHNGRLSQTMPGHGGDTSSAFSARPTQKVSYYIISASGLSSGGGP